MKTITAKQIYTHTTQNLQQESKRFFQTKCLMRLHCLVKRDRNY